MAGRRNGGVYGGAAVQAKAAGPPRLSASRSRAPKKPLQQSSAGLASRPARCLPALGATRTEQLASGAGSLGGEGELLLAGAHQLDGQL